MENEFNDSCRNNCGLFDFMSDTIGIRVLHPGGYAATDQLCSWAKLNENTNVLDLAKYRESILPYLKVPVDKSVAEKQEKLWREYDKAAVSVDQAHGMFLSGRFRTPAFAALMAPIDSRYPHYAPWRFLKNEYREEIGRDPRPLRQMTITLVKENGKQSSALLGGHCLD